jgi:hypothetical protein
MKYLDLAESWQNISSLLNLVLGFISSSLEGLIRLSTIGLRKRWNDYLTHDSFDLADTRSGFSTSYPWK